LGYKKLTELKGLNNVKFTCKCGGTQTRIPDVLDVWIDAGSAAWNCLHYPKTEDNWEMFPADFILEATEQVRLWFSILSVCSEVALQKPAFKATYTTGMILDYQGMKMSKSTLHASLITENDIVEIQ